MWLYFKMELLSHRVPTVSVLLDIANLLSKVCVSVDIPSSRIYEFLFCQIWLPFGILGLLKLLPIFWVRNIIHVLNCISLISKVEHIFFIGGSAPFPWITCLYLLLVVQLDRFSFFEGGYACTWWSAASILERVGTSCNSTFVTNVCT